MQYESHQIENEGALAAARMMSVAARTAPKAKGVDIILTLVLTGEDKDRLAAEMRRTGEEKNIAFFKRDADNIKAASAVVLIGMKNSPRNVPNCGFCGYEDCAANTRAKGICAMCTTDLGIALGSAAASAADFRIDSRIMFSAGKTALDTGLLPGAASAFGIPVSVSGKSPFFDRG